MKSLRHAITGFAVILLMLFAIGAAAPYLADGGTIRSQLFSKMSGWADGRLQVNGPVYLTSLFDLTIEAHDVEIRNPARFAEVKTLRAERIAARLSLWDLLNRRITFEKVWLNGLTVSLREKPGSFSAVDLWNALVLNDPPVLDEALRHGKDAPFKTMVVRNARLEVADDVASAFAGLGSYSGVVRRARGGGAFSITGGIEWRGERIEVDLRRTRFTPEGPTHMAELRAGLESASLGRIEVNGRIVQANGDRFIGRIEANQAHVQPVAALLDIPGGAVLAQARLSFSADVLASPWEIALQNLQFGVGATQASGLLRIELSDRPKITGTLGLGALDLSGLRTGVISADARPDEGAAPASALEAVVARFDLDLRLSAESIVLDDISTGPAAAFLSANDGLAAVELAELMVFGGTVNGQFTGRWSDGGFSMSGKGRAENVDLAQVLTLPGAVPLATGIADISFTISSASDGLKGLAQSARLSGRLVSDDGGELALDVASLAARHREDAVLGEAQGEAITITANRGAYDSMSCAFAFRGNRLDVHSLAIVQDQWLIRGRGGIDLAQQIVDWRFEAAQAAGAIEARMLPLRDSALTSDTEDAIELRVQGPLHGPRVIFRAPAIGMSGVRG
jgi:uncharacterized protein involved in outer membrane biogenesis